MKSSTRPKLHRLYYLAVVLAAMFTATVQAQLSLTSGLVSYYPFNGNANDAIGANNGTVYGAVLSTNRFGQPNSAYLFNGSSSYIDFGAPTNLKFTNNFTLTAWCLFSGGSQQNPRIISYTWGNGYELLTTGTGTSRTFEFDIGAYPFKTTLSYTQNVWYAVVLAVTNGTAHFYVNGQSAGSGAVPPPITFTNNLHIGNNSGTATSDYWGGSIDDVRFYNRALSSNEVAQLYSIETTLLPIGISTYSNNPVVFFPSNGTSYNLQMTTNLSSPVWVTITNGVPFSAVEITNAPGNAFFRLAN